MHSKISFTFACILLGISPLFAQDLGQLRARATKLWELRKASDRVEALQLIDPEARQTYLQSNETPIVSFKISGMEFPDDLNRADVLVKVHAMLPQVGEIDRTVRESWVWKNGEWFMHAMPARGLFDSDAEKKPSVPVLPQFEITNTVVDAGRHSQGDLIEGKIGFHAHRGDIKVIRPLQRIQGLSIGSQVWTSPTEGYLSYRWETALVSQDINQTVTLEATATSDVRVTAGVQFRARIDGRVRFTQIPEILDATKDGQVELRMQNLSTKPLKILSVMSYNPAYVLDENVTELIEPGKSGRLVIRYSGSLRPTGSAVTVVFSEDFGGSPLVTVPLNIQMPEPKKPASYAPEDLNKIINTMPKPNLP